MTKTQVYFCLPGFNCLWFVYIFSVFFQLLGFICVKSTFRFVCLFRLFKNQTEIFLYIFIIFLFFLFVCSFAVVFLGITPRGEIIKC